MTKESEVWFGVELLAGALARQLTSTRFVWKRVPADMKKASKNLQIVWKLLQSLHRGDFATFFAESVAFHGGLTHPLLQQMNAALRGETQSANILNIRRAYTTISVDQAASLLGTKRAEAVQLMTKLGWTPDEKSEFFNPTPLAIPKQREISERQIEQLTRYVADLEKE